MKDIREGGGLRGSRFIHICLSNFLLHAFVFLLIPLTEWHAVAIGAERSIVGWAVLAFAAGRFVPGPFGAHLMECRPRKHTAIWSVLALGLLSLVPATFPNETIWLVASYGLQGLCFGLAQTALGATLVNDVLRSHERDRGDMRYAWAGRMGMPTGLLVGAMLPVYISAGTIVWYALIPCVLALLLIAQTSVPLKAPVPTTAVSLDRFLLPRSLHLSLSLFAAPFVLGHVTANLDAMGALLIATGFVAIFVSQILFHFPIGQRTAVSTGYFLIVIGQIAISFGSVGCVLLVTLPLTGAGVAVVSSRHLLHWTTLASHCQRGTAQSTHMLSCRTAFSLGFACAYLFPAFQGLWLTTLCMAAMCLYLLWPCNAPVDNI